PALIQHHLRPLIDYRAGVAAERHAVLLALKEVLTHLRPDLFQQETQMRGDRIVAQNRVALLDEVANANRRQASEDDERYQNQIEDFVIHNPDTEKQSGDDSADRKD